MKQKKIIAGNWKMNLDLEEGLKLIGQIAHYLKNIPYKNDAFLGDDFSTNVILSPNFTILASAFEQIKSLGLPIFLSAQNVSEYSSGAHTGEVSVSMLKSCGVTHVILGHSERRQSYQDTNEKISVKLTAALSHHLSVILCVGETEQQRDAGELVAILRQQLTQCLKDLPTPDKVIIAYEPVWAIGTGKTATLKEAEEAHREIRSILQEIFGNSSASIPILYGGSLKPENAKELLSSSVIDGGLIGGASLKAKDFLSIIETTLELSAK